MTGKINDNPQLENSLNSPKKIALGTRQKDPP